MELLFWETSCPDSKLKSFYASYAVTYPIDTFTVCTSNAALTSFNNNKKKIFQRHQISGQGEAYLLSLSTNDSKLRYLQQWWATQDVPIAGGHHLYNPLKRFRPDSVTTSYQVLNVSYSKTIPQRVTQCNLTNCSTKCVSLLTVCHKCGINT